MRGVVNIIFGLIMLGGGLSGKLALIGTNSSWALAGIGGVVLGIGVAQFVRGLRSSAE